MATAKNRVEPSKELELLNFRTFLLENPELFVGQRTPNEQIKITRLNTNNKVLPESKNTNNEEMNQFISFQRVMKILLICGQCLGLNPVTGILEKDVTKIRYHLLSWKVLYSIIIGLLQFFAAVSTIYRLFITQNMFIRVLAFSCFYICTCFTTFIFLRVAVKWPSLMNELLNSGLHQYTDSKLKYKCYLAYFIIIFFALLEYSLSQISRYTEVVVCTSKDNDDVFDFFFYIPFPWVNELAMKDYFWPISIMLQIIITITTFNMSYADLFIICISLYLSSIMNCINQRIESAYKNNYLPPSFWRCLREDYNRATQLVRSFDDRICGIVLVFFANNMFFICLQLYYSLANGLRQSQQYFKLSCPNYLNGPFGGYETTIHQIYSLCFLISKFLAVSLIASDVHIASIKPAPVLYNVALSMYCDEVQRFLDQVHGDTIAISGFQFFYVTREIILSVAGTIITYELVMLQFSGEDASN